MMKPDIQRTEGHETTWIGRAWRALLSRRIPYRLRRLLDPIMPSIGVRYRTVSIDGLSVRIRWNSWDDRTVRRVIGEREYNPTGTEIRPGDCVIDIGANIGAFAIVAGSAAPGVRVYAFEPDADNWALASKNAEINGLDNVKVIRKAVSGEAGTLRLYKGAQGSLHTTVPGRLDEAADHEDVESVTLAAIMDDNAIDVCAFLKLDCEGAEYEILYRTPPEYLARIRQIAVKYHAHEDKERKAKELFRFLEQAGFEIVEVEDHVGRDDGLARARRRSS